MLAVAQGWLGIAGDPGQEPSHCDFPVFTWQHLENFRTLFHPEQWGWGADHWLTQAYLRAQRTQPIALTLTHRPADQARQAAINLWEPDAPTSAALIRWARTISSSAFTAES